MIREVSLNYNLLGNSYICIPKRSYQRTYNIREKIAIQFRTSLQILKEYFKKVFHVPIEIYSGDALVGVAKIQLDSLIRVSDLQEFLSTYSVVNYTYDIDGVTYVEPMREGYCSIKPHIEYRFTIKYLETRRKISVSLEGGGCGSDTEKIDEEKEIKSDEKITERLDKISEEENKKPDGEEVKVPDPTEEIIKPVETVIKKEEITVTESTKVEETKKADVKDKSDIPMEPKTHLSVVELESESESSVKQKPCGKYSGNTLHVPDRNFEKNCRSETNLQSGRYKQPINKKACSKRSLPSYNYSSQPYTNIDSVLRENRGNIGELPRVISFNLQIKSLKFYKKPENGVWQFCFHHEKSDNSKVIVNRDIKDVAENIDTFEFDDLELKLFFTTKVEALVELLKLPESCVLSVKGPHQTVGRAFLDCNNLVIGSKEKIAGNVLLQSPVSFFNCFFYETRFFVFNEKTLNLNPDIYFLNLFKLTV